MTRHPSGLLRISPEVEDALVRSQPVVALESSLVAHGLPPDIGPGVGRAAEERVREHGAVPATIAVVDGTVRVGIDDAVLDRLAVEPDVRKVGPRDLATSAVSGAWGATTVAGTLAVCAVAGIHFMAHGRNRRRPPRMGGDARHLGRPRRDRRHRRVRRLLRGEVAARHPGHARGPRDRSACR